MFPHLAKELEGEWMQIEAVRTDSLEAEKAYRDGLEGYDPTVIDFLRRCDTEEQGLEIIDYMKERKEISEKYATELKVQLLRNGIRSFGPKRESY